MNKLLLSLLFSSILLTGCGEKEIEVGPEASTPIEMPEPVVGETNQGNANAEGKNTTPVIAGNEVDAKAITDEPLSAEELLEEKDSPLTTRIIYFEFNSAKVDEESLLLLQTHGEFISENGNVNVRLEGHADERGSREFNVALGDRRNQTVRRLLLFQGASSDQIETVSYGEELPAVLGHNEASWAKNRRVELIYKVK